MGLKRVLIISPYFPPSNSADMQRVRMSLPYFSLAGWEAEVVTVDPRHSDLVKDYLLSKSISAKTIIHLVNALPKRWTTKLGLGSIAIRSLWFYRQKVNSLLKQKKYDLVYFSTTQFPVCVLGAYWNRRFGVPYVVDMQDPWHSEYYRDKPKVQRPPKYWFSYRLNKWLEPIALRKAGGLISVSQAYIDDLKKRYPSLREIPSAVITFGAFEKDFEIAENNAGKMKSFIQPQDGRINIVYVGRGGYDMHKSVRLLFRALQKGLSLQPELFNRFHISFIGTSYAAAGNGLKSIQPLAVDMGLKELVTEITDRIGFYESIATLQSADILFIPGSDDPNYTASKLYPYIMSQKPILAIFNETSSVVHILRTCSPESKLFTFPGNEDELVEKIYQQLLEWLSVPLKSILLDQKIFNNYSSQVMTAKQAALFDQVISE